MNLGLEEKRRFGNKDNNHHTSGGIRYNTIWNAEKTIVVGLDYQTGMEFVIVIKG